MLFLAFCFAFLSFLLASGLMGNFIRRVAGEGVLSDDLQQLLTRFSQSKMRVTTIPIRKS